MDKYTARLIAHFKEIVPLDENDIKTIIPKLEIKELDKRLFASARTGFQTYAFYSKRKPAYLLYG